MSPAHIIHYTELVFDIDRGVVVKGAMPPQILLRGSGTPLSVPGIS